jgi:hypothetical protein
MDKAEMVRLLSIPSENWQVSTPAFIADGVRIARAVQGVK